MKFLYHQSKNSVLKDYGLENCYLKSISYSNPNLSISSNRNMHCHTEFEIQIITSGFQIYETSDRRYELTAGHFIIFPPSLKHKMVDVQLHTEKLAFVFRIDAAKMGITLPKDCGCVFGKLSEELNAALNFIKARVQVSSIVANRLSENRIYEAVMLFLKEMEITEEQFKKTVRRTAPVTLALAKQYIEDNIESALTVEDIVLYCHMEKRQLARIFKEHEGVSLFDYIRNRRTEYIKILLADSTLSLKEISERMHFRNEYYFNKFCKMHCELPPGAYRKAIVTDSVEAPDPPPSKDE